MNAAGQKMSLLEQMSEEDEKIFNDNQKEWSKPVLEEFQNGLKKVDMLLTEVAGEKKRAIKNKDLSLETRIDEMLEYLEDRKSNTLHIIEAGNQVTLEAAIKFLSREITHQELDDSRKKRVLCLRIIKCCRGMVVALKLMSTNNPLPWHMMFAGFAAQHFAKLSDDGLEGVATTHELGELRHLFNRIIFYIEIITTGL